MESGLLLDVIVRQSTTIFQLLAGEDEALLVGRDTFFVLNFRLHVVNRILRLDFEGDCFAGEGFHEDLHTTSETKNKMKGRLLLNVIIGESAAVFELLSGEDKSLLIRGDTNQH